MSGQAHNRGESILLLCREISDTRTALYITIPAVNRKEGKQEKHILLDVHINLNHLHCPCFPKWKA